MRPKRYCIGRARRRTQLGNRSTFHASGLLVALLGLAACGARTPIETDLSPSTQTPDAGAAAGASGGSSWERVIWDGVFGESVSYLWTASVNSTWAVVSDSDGSFGREHWDGLRWTRTVAASDPRAPFDDSQIWAADSGEAFAGSSANLQRWFGQIWLPWTGTPGCHALAGRAPDDLWCATDTELWRLDAGGWTHQAMAGVRGILARARNDVWVWGERGASHFDGVSFRLELGDPVKRVSASAPDDVWAVQDGNLLHSTGPGTPWTRQNPTGGQISSVWSQAANNTWIVAAGAAMRWNGSSWALMPLPMQDERLLISGSSEDIWIAGTLTLIHGHPVHR